MRLIPLPDQADLLSGFPCARCFGELEIHQLDVDLPGRLLGTCPECKAWYLVSIEASRMLLLPDDIGHPDG